MPNTRPPDKYNFEDLYLYCELSTNPESGSRVDFSGIKTYNIGFLKEGVGFGITNISVDITPSMQPVVEITFKDFYGNSAIEFKRNKEFLSGLIDNTNEINYATLFELPYPKFRLVLKGYIGKPVSLDLNVKRIDVTYAGNDGSYEIKAVFIPNLYGFFADMPYYFLKSIKYLKYVNSGKQIPNDYMSIFDVIESGKIVQQNQMVTQRNIEKLKKNLLILDSESSAMFDDDFNWFDPSLLDDKDSNQQSIDGYKKLYINVGKFTSKKNKNNNTALLSPTDYAKRNKQSIAQVETNQGTKLFREKIISSISLTNEHESKNDSKIVYLLDEPLNRSNYNRGKALIKKAIEYCKEYEKSQLRATNRSVIEKLTIQKVFDLLIQDSAYLMGRILQAGMSGYKNEPGRATNKEITGKYFPLIQDANTKEQRPYATSGPEANFVNDFINALSNGLAEEERKKINEDPVVAQDNSENSIKKRITNLEIGSINPYVNAVTSEQIISNIIERTGLMSHYFMNAISVFSFSINDEDKEDLIAAEIENIKIGLSKVLGSGEGDDRTDLLNFFDSVDKLINDEGNFRETNPNLSVITNRISNSSGINKQTLTSSKLFNNNIYYFADETPNGNDTYVLFDLDKLKKNPFIASSIGSADVSFFSSIIGTDSDSTNPIGEKDYSYTYVEKDDDGNIPFNVMINSNLVYDFHKLQNNPSDISSALVSEPISDTGRYLYSEKKYFYAKYRSGFRNDDAYNVNNTPVIWNFNGDTSESRFQRYILKEISRKLKGEVANAENTIKNETQSIVQNLQSGDGYKILYKQFYTLCNNWRNLVDSNILPSSVVEHVVEKFFPNGNSASNVFYEFPLQNIQNNSSINIKDSIINIDPLYKNNEQSTVLNVMSNICLKNNFMFLAIPGMAETEKGFITNDPLDDLFNPYTKLIEYGSIPPMNHFYVLWMPTPEDRVTYNNGDELYLDFNADNLNLSRDVFIIDYGSSDNTIFKNLSMTTEDNKMTSESAIAINTIADASNSNNYKSFDCSALSVMEGRSYKISVEMIGNAQIKPTQFFILNSTHIFSGLYQIMKVSHTIRPNDMTTKFEAIKMKYNGQFAGFTYIPPITLQDIYQQSTSNLDNKSNISDDFASSDSETFSVIDVKNNPTQTAELNKLHPKIRDVFKNFVYEVENTLGYHVKITSSYRSTEEQRVLNAQNGNNANAGFSYHNYGMAIDINLQKEGVYIKKNSPKFQWISTGILNISEKYKLVWGGNFSTYYDPVHFDARNYYDIKILNQTYTAELQVNNKIEGNEINLA